MKSHNQRRLLTWTRDGLNAAHGSTVLPPLEEKIRPLMLGLSKD